MTKTETTSQLPKQWLTSSDTSSSPEPEKHLNFWSRKTSASKSVPLQRCASHLASATDQSEAFALGEHAVLLAEEGVTASMVTLTRTSNTPYAVAYDHAPIRGIANEAKSIPREWINAHGNDIRQELYNYLYPLIQGEVSLTYQNGVPVYMPVPHLKPDHIS